MTKITLDALDLGALLCSRVCHDVISPVGAIVNGLEVLAEEKDESMREFAHDLIRKSATQASARLQFARLAFGAAGSAGAMIDLGDAEQVARGFFHDERTKLIWNAPRALLPKNQVKLLLNMLVMAQTTIPRGGTVTVQVTGESDQIRVSVVAAGPSARIPAALPGLLSGESESGSVDSHAIQPYYAGLVARAEQMVVNVTLEGETVSLIAHKG
jgi:histidine phosphotransferase ChpT